MSAADPAQAAARTPATRTPFGLRVWRAALLHADTYEEVEADRSSITQAMAVVAVACAAAGLGS